MQCRVKATLTVFNCNPNWINIGMLAHRVWYSSCLCRQPRNKPVSEKQLLLESPECCFLYSQVDTFGNADLKKKLNVLDVQTFNREFHFILNPQSPIPQPLSSSDQPMTFRSKSKRDIFYLNPELGLGRLTTNVYSGLLCVR